MTGTSDDSQPRIVHDCVESVGYRQNRATGKLFTNRRLDETIRLQVDGRSRLVQHQDLRLAQNGSCQTDQLAMSKARSRRRQMFYYRPNDRRILLLHCIFGESELEDSKISLNKRPSIFLKTANQFSSCKVDSLNL